MNKRTKRLLLVGLMIVLGTGLIHVTPAPAQDPIPLWPTDGWETSTPEAQGMDSEQLAVMFETIQAEELAIDSVVIVRNGYLVTDAYFYPSTPTSRHELFSVTKSISSTLVGIALDQGYIESIDQPVLGFFPGRSFASVDANKEAMTLQHLLTMTTGLDWQEWGIGYTTTENDTIAMITTSADWVQFVLDQPMADQPGTHFNYCSGCSHILSAIIQETTGANTRTFAQEHLFDPLGITRVTWPSDPQGVSQGGFGLRLTPQDMAKIGYLYLHGGEWDGEQIVSAAWVNASTTDQIPGRTPDGYEYGYQWWILGDALYAAMGLHGQFIFVLPRLNMVVVFTSDLDEDDTMLPQALLEGIIIPAAQSPTPLPENPAGVALLEAYIQAAANPAPVPE